MAAKRIFLSYAWDDDSYRLWARKLATRFREDGIDARLDAWHGKSTDNFSSFMNSEVRHADRVLVLCSPVYRTKVHAAEDGLQLSGAAWEAQLLENLMLARNEKKVLVALALGAKDASIPDFLSGKPYFDLSHSGTFETYYRQLRGAITGSYEVLEPLGRLLADLEPEPVEPLRGDSPAVATPRLRDPAEQIYRDFVIQTCRGLGLAGLQPGGGQASHLWRILSLPDVFIEPSLTTHYLAVSKKSAISTATKKLEKQPALRIPSHQEKVLLIGGPGAGKTTFLHYLAYCLAKGDSTSLPQWPEDLASALPLLVDLRQFSSWLRKTTYPKRSRQLLWFYILYGIQLQRPEVQRFLEASIPGALLTFVLLDGLDEVDEEMRAEVCETITNFAEDFSSCRFVITSRDLDESWGEIAAWPRYELAPFDEQQRVELLAAWKAQLLASPLLEKEGIEQRFSRLEKECRRSEIQRLAESPLLLSLIAVVYLEKGQLPRERSLLFGEIVKLLLWDWERGKRDKGDVDPISACLAKSGASKEDLRKYLDRVAFEAQRASAREGESGEGGDEGASGFDEADARKILIKLLPHESYEWAGELLHLVQMRTGLVNFGPGDALAFPHRSIREYMAGTHLARQNNFGQLLLPLARRWMLWSEPIRLAVNHLSYAEKEQERPLVLIDVLSDPASSPEGLQLARASELARELDIESVRRIPWGGRLLDRLRRQLADLIEGGALSESERASVGDNLGMLGDPRFEAASPWLPALYSSRPEPLRGFVEIPACSVSWTAAPYRYWVGRYPVTVGQFAAFIDDDGYNSSDLWSPTGWKWRQVTFIAALAPDDPDRWVEQFLDLRAGNRRDLPKDWEEQRLYPNRALGGVSWFEAAAYANWLDVQLRADGSLPSGYCVRLPTEAEWAGAACPENHQTYPWGDDAEIEDRANVIIAHGDRRDATEGRNALRHASTVGMYPLGASRSGILDLSGNVEEWTASRYWPFPYSSSDGRNRAEPVTREPWVLRGGSFQSDTLEASCSARQFDYPHVAEMRQGMRVVISVPIEKAI